MARKTYTEEDRARVRQALLDTGLNMAVSKGLKGLHLAELAAAGGGSGVRPRRWGFPSPISTRFLTRWRIFPSR